MTETITTLIQATSSSRVENLTPQGYRLARKPNGELLLQAAFQWSDGINSGLEWRDIPTVDLP